MLKSKNRLHLQAAAKCVMFHRVTVDATSLWELMWCTIADGKLPARDAVSLLLSNFDLTLL